MYDDFKLKKNPLFFMVYTKYFSFVRVKNYCTSDQRVIIVMTIYLNNPGSQAFPQYWFSVGPPSATRAQHYETIM